MPDLAQLIDGEPHKMYGLIQTPLYKEKVNGNLTGKHEADLLSVTGNTNKTYNDRYTQSINGPTEMEYNSRKVICNGLYTQSAEGDKTTTCVASDIQICLGLKSTQKIGPGFFTISVVYSSISLGMEVFTTPMSVEIGILRLRPCYGVFMGVVGADVMVAHSSVGTPLQLIENTVLSSSDIRSELDLSGTWDYRNNRQDRSDRRSPPPSFPPPPPPVVDLDLPDENYEDVDDFQQGKIYTSLQEQEYLHMYSLLTSFKQDKPSDTPPPEDKPSDTPEENTYETPIDAQGHIYDIPT